MTQNYNNNGFTLVELAIALMVIGLLIGGVLKGQELIENARLTRTMKDVKDFNAAVLIFQNTYDALPGDIRQPDRLPNCVAVECNAAGNDNGRVGREITAAGGGITNVSVEGKEQRRFWVHLTKTGLLSGVINPDYVGTPDEAGVDFPKSPYGLSFFITDFQVTSFREDFPFHDQNEYHHFVMLSNPTYGRSFLTQQGDLKAATAARFDEKFDDGVPSTGSIRAGKGRVTLPCTNNDGSEYQTQNANAVCPLAFVAAF